MKSRSLRQWDSSWRKIQRYRSPRKCRLLLCFPSFRFSSLWPRKRGICYNNTRLHFVRRLTFIVTVFWQQKVSSSSTPVPPCSASLQQGILYLRCIWFAISNNGDPFSRCFFPEQVLNSSRCDCVVMVCLFDARHMFDYQWGKPALNLPSCLHISFSVTSHILWDFIH